MDVIFLLDGSESVKKKFQKVKNWTISLAFKLVEQNNNTQVGVNQYSSKEKFKTEIKLAEVTNQDNFNVNYFIYFNFQAYTKLSKYKYKS